MFHLDRSASLILLVAAGLIVPALFAVPGCSDEPDRREVGGVQPDGDIYHPVADSIPYIDRDHIPLSRDHSIENAGELPEQIQVLADYLQSPDGYDDESQNIDLLLNSHTRAEYASLSSERVIIHDLLDDRLYDYNLTEGEGTKLNKHGEGPGDLNSTMQIARQDDDIYVSMHTRRIAQFNCAAEPCEFYEQRTTPEIRPEAITVTSDSLIAAISIEGRDIADSGYQEGLVRLIDTNGDGKGGFGTGYLSTVPIVREMLLRDSDLEWVEAANKYVVMFLSTPFIYVYDEGGEISATFEIKDYVPHFFGYRVAEDRGRMWGQSATRLMGIDNINTEYVVLRAVTIAENESDVTFDYYALNLQEMKGYHIGSNESTLFEQHNLVTTEYGLVRVTRDSLGFIPF